MQKAAPTPLFNYRKRQCQAIFSDPQQLAANKAAPDCPQVPFHGQDVGVDRQQATRNSVMNQENMASQFSRANMSFPHSGNVAKSINAADTAKRPSCGFVRQNNPGLMNVRGQFIANSATTPTQQWSNSKFAGQRLQGSQSIKYIQGGNKQPNPSNSCRTVTATSSVFRPQSSSFTASSSSSSSSSAMMKTIATKAQAAGPENRFTSEYNSTAKVLQQGRSTPLCKNQVLKNAPDNTPRARACPNTAPLTRKDGVPYKFSTGPTSQPRNCSGIQWNSTRATQNKNSDLKFKEDNNMDFMYGDDFTDENSRDSVQKKGINQGKQVLNSPVKPDLSLRIWTCTIAMMKSWAAHNEHAGLVMFEIFGVIDSAMVRDHTRTGREFLLRDDTSTVTCVFYEIDRDMPRLIRGQVCRVMASALDKENRLHIVSVRAALVEERQVCQVATQLSQAEMDRLAM